MEEVQSDYIFQQESGVELGTDQNQVKLHTGSKTFY